MQISDKTPPITSLLRGITWIETLVLLAAGGALFFSPDWTREQWAWELTPFNTRFLGAIYLSAMLSIGLMAWVSRWSVARLGLRTIFIFTLIILVVSLFYTDRFDFDKWSTWLWFALYVLLPANAAWHLWLYRSMPTDQFLTVSPFWRMLLGVAGSLLLIYGLGLLILPDPVSDSFPWVLDEFHSRLYSATFIAGGAALLTVALKTLPIEFIAAGSAEAAVGLLAILGLVIVDQKADRIDWSATDTRGWLAMFAALLILGVMMIANGIRQIRAQSR